MLEFFQHLFDPSGFPARWTCGEWTAGHGWLHILSDLAIWGAYTAIPLVLAYFTVNRRDLPFSRIFWCFFLFILFCGTTHLIDAAMFWWPAYRLSGLVKLGTAVVSWATVLLLIRVTPEALKLPGMARLNQELNDEIEERLRAETAFRETERRLRTVIDAIPGLVALIDKENRFIYANETYRNWFGLDPVRLQGKPTQEIMTPEAYEGIRRWIEAAQEGRSVSYETEIRFGDGSLHHVSASYVPQFSRSGEPSGYLALVTDITERRRGEDRFRIAVEAAPNAMILVDAAGSIVLGNSQTEKIFGYSREELDGKAVEILVPERYRPEHPGHRSQYMRESTTRAMGVGRDLAGRRKDGSEFPVEIGLTPIRTPEGTFVLAAIVDITERKQIETALRAASRLEATAALAGGVAHDFNNLMVGVLGSASMLRLELGEGHAGSDSVELIESSAARAAMLAQQLLAYARGGRYQPRRMELNEAVREVINLQDPSRSGSVEIEVRLAEAPWPVEADPSQMVQVVMNLCLNAVEAIEATGRPGRMLIETDQIELDGELELPHFPALPPGRYCRVRVTDDGIGIEAEKFRQLFEPFYTTKFQGRGLGLAALYGIVQNHGGAVRVESEPGRGSVFEVWIPSPGPGA